MGKPPLMNLVTRSDTHMTGNLILINRDERLKMNSAAPG